MLEIKLLIDVDTTLADLRQFVRMTAEAPADMVIASYDMHTEMDGIAAIIHPTEAD